MKREDDDTLNAPQRSPEELREALVNCERRLAEVKRTKKSVTKDYADQIKDIDTEIAGILEQLQ